jgi:hypothetical protein
LLRPSVTIKSLPAPAETTGRSKERGRRPVTVTEPRGEPIAQIAVVSNDEDFEWRENPRRVVRSCVAGPSGRGGLSELGADRDSGAPCCGGKRYRRDRKRVRGEGEGSRSRHPAESPRRGKAQGSIRFGAALNRGAVQGTLGRVKARKSRPVVPAGAASVALANRRVERQAGPPRGVMVSGTFREGKASKGVKNPRSAVGMKQGRPGVEGRKPSRG